MDNSTATMIAEGVQDADEDTVIQAWQHLVDTGLVWQLQGFFGRQAARLIAAGVIKDTHGVLSRGRMTSKEAL